MAAPFATAFDHAMHAAAIGMVDAERIRQITEKGYTCGHDDVEHGGEELAAAAAFYLLPAAVNPDVCHANGMDGLVLEPLLDMIGAHAWPDIERTDEALFDDADGAALDERIETVKVGAALAIAELERLLRIRNKQDVSKDGY